MSQQSRPYLSERRSGTVREQDSPDGRGWSLGTAHQTGWTGIVAGIICRRRGTVASIADVLVRPGVPGRRP